MRVFSQCMQVESLLQCLFFQEQVQKKLPAPPLPVTPVISQSASQLESENPFRAKAFSGEKKDETKKVTDKEKPEKKKDLSMCLTSKGSPTLSIRFTLLHSCRILLNLL